MSAALLASVAGLAVLDMLSPAAIAVTIAVVLTAGRRAGRLLLVYWTTVAVSYLLLGVALMLGLGALLTVVDETVRLWVQLVVGAAMLVGSFFVPDRPADRARSRTTPRTLSASGMVALGLGTWLLEAAFAVPYLGAIALLTSAGLPAVQWVPVLAGYTVLMMAPCVVLLAGWSIVGERMRPRLERWRDRLVNGSRSAVGWIVGIAGFLVARDALSRLLEGPGIDLLGR